MSSSFRTDIFSHGTVTESQCEAKRAAASSPDNRTQFDKDVDKLLSIGFKLTPNQALSINGEIPYRWARGPVTIECRVKDGKADWEFYIDELLTPRSDPYDSGGMFIQGDFSTLDDLMQYVLGKFSAALEGL